MADFRKKLRRQEARRKRRVLYRQIKEELLLDWAYRGLSVEQMKRDRQLETQQQWLKGQLGELPA